MASRAAGPKLSAAPESGPNQVAMAAASAHTATVLGSEGFWLRLRLMAVRVYLRLEVGWARRLARQQRTSTKTAAGMGTSDILQPDLCTWSTPLLLAPRTGSRSCGTIPKPNLGGRARPRSTLAAE